MFWSVVGLASTVTIVLSPETKGDNSLSDTEDSEDVYSCIMMGEEAGGLLCFLVC